MQPNSNAWFFIQYGGREEKALWKGRESLVEEKRKPCGREEKALRKGRESLAEGNRWLGGVGFHQYGYDFCSLGLSDPP